ncbi:MAG: DUF2017 domain-containing protein [Propionibacteriaceae bacterium]|nr:DUF2017 domain-containing protein [Propionibacteriaceae bacterium]
MKDFSREGQSLRLRLSTYEAAILTSMVEQVAGLLEGDAPLGGDDPFARWQAELAPPVELDFSDPVIARLFPEAYPSDQSASDEFRRLTLAGQRQQRLDDAAVVLEALRGANGRRLTIASGQAEAWLKTLTAVRLSLAIRLEIDTEDDARQAARFGPDDPRSFVFQVYEWLAYLSEGILGLLG